MQTGLYFYFVLTQTLELKKMHTSAHAMQTNTVLCVNPQLWKHTSFAQKKVCMSICIKIQRQETRRHVRQISANFIKFNYPEKSFICVKYSNFGDGNPSKVLFFWTGCGKPHVVFFILFFISLNKGESPLGHSDHDSPHFLSMHTQQGFKFKFHSKGDDVFTRRFDEPNKHIRFTQIRIPLSPLHSGHHSKLPSHGLRAGFLYASRVCHYFLGKLTICQIGKF